MEPQTRMFVRFMLHAAAMTLLSWGFAFGVLVVVAWWQHGSL